MCGRYVINFAWAEIALLYRLGNIAPPNIEPNFNVCPTQSVYAVVPEADLRELVPMRWSLIPGWWSKSLMRREDLVHGAVASV